MARRKLSKDYEKKISSSLKELELILAKINDIDEDDIREEYSISFAPIKAIITKISSSYKEVGFTDESDQLFEEYLKLLNNFKSEYEI